MDTNEFAQIEAALGGDAAAFEAVIPLYGRRLFAVAYGILQNRAEAEDVVQDVLLKAYRLREKVRDPEKFPAWIGTMARNAACDALRKRRTVPLPPEAEEFADGAAPSAHGRLEASERNGQVAALLAGLPESHRTAVTLRFMEGMDYAAIAGLMGITHGALRGILGRAMGSLRRDLNATPLPQGEP